MSPYRPTPKARRLALPIYVQAIARRSVVALRASVALSLGVPMLVGVLSAGCAKFWGAAAPTLDCASKVSEDAAQNMSVAQIVMDLPAQCGMDAAAVMAILLGTQNAKVAASPAHAEAVRARAMLASPPAVAACGK